MINKIIFYATDFEQGRTMKILSISSVVVGMLFVVNAATGANQEKWMFASADNDSEAFVTVASQEIENGLRQIDFLRNYAEQINLGVDPVTGMEWYPHQSVAITYEVNCERSSLAMRSWTMYRGVGGVGEITWADKNHGYPPFVIATSNEELAVVGAACGEKVAYSLKSGSQEPRL